MWADLKGTKIVKVFLFYADKSPQSQSLKWKLVQYFVSISVTDFEFLFKEKLNLLGYSHFLTEYYKIVTTHRPISSVSKYNFEV